MGWHTLDANGACGRPHATLPPMPAVFYRFADFRLNPATRELQRGTELVALPPRAFDCLAYLVERRERAIGRDELIAAVWGKAEVSDTLLASGRVTCSTAATALKTGLEHHVRRIERSADLIGDAACR